MDAEAHPGPISAIARGFAARAKAWGRAVATPGSPGSFLFAAVVGVFAFTAAVASGPIAPREAEAAPAIRRDLPLTDVAVRPAPLTPAQPGDLAPIGAPPPPAIDTALDYAVAYYWPLRPQTVTAPAAIREGPAPWAKVLRQARPGERLRINGRTIDAPGGPWLRIRLSDGRDGYVAGRTIDADAWRRQRAASVQTAAVADGPVAADAVGAPLAAAGPDEGPDPDVVDPPSF
jgi:hypothetical protein